MVLFGGRDPRDIVRAGASAALHRNRTGQILCTLQALAAAAALRDAMPGRLVIAGYSIGELAAWGVAELFGAMDTLDLAARRAEAMDAAAPPGGGLLFVRGLSRQTIDRLCARHDAAVAIVNPGQAFIIGGSRVNLDALAADARALNAARAIDVPVEVAAHTAQMARASAEFRQILSDVPLTRAPAASARILSGVDALPVLDVQTGLDKLAAQISRTVRWADCLGACREAGATVFLELGPGRALSRMVAAAWPGVSSRSLDDFRSVQGARAWLHHAAG